MEFKIEPVDGDTWRVWNGRYSLGDFVRGDVVFFGSLADCYAWTKVKKGNLFLCT